MTAKLLATGAAAVAAAAGMTSVALGTASASQAGLQVQPVTGTYAQDPPPGTPEALPTPEQLSNLCTQATDPGVSYTTKTNLVENGISSGEGHLADHNLRKAYRDGKFPESFNVTNIQPAGPNMASADVAISGPKLAGPVIKQLVFVNQDGSWVLQHDAALALLQAATA